MSQGRIDIDRDKLLALRERVRRRAEIYGSDPTRIHDACFLAEIVADIDEIGWPDLAIGRKLHLHDNETNN